MCVSWWYRQADPHLSSNNFRQENTKHPVREEEDGIMDPFSSGDYEKKSEHPRASDETGS
jgi:hypothetical protein